jgi:large subunit ribosomal protein L21
MFAFLGVPVGIQPEIPAPKSETCCISDSNIPNFNATLRDSFWTPLGTTGQAFMFRAEYSLAIFCWQQLVEDGFQMFAVIEDGNRQHRVQEGSFLSVDYRGTEVEAGSSITFDRVLLANGGGASIVGAPTISGASVVAEVVIATEKGPKLEIQRLRKRKNSRRHTGHRQKYTRVKVTSITIPGLAVAEK